MTARPTSASASKPRANSAAMSRDALGVGGAHRRRLVARATAAAPRRASALCRCWSPRSAVTPRKRMALRRERESATRVDGRPGAYPRLGDGRDSARRRDPLHVRRSPRARRVRVNVHAHAEDGRRRGRAAGARARAGRGRRRQRAAPVDRAPPERGPRRARPDQPRARARCPTSDARSSWSRRPGARACTAAASGCWCPTAIRARRSSASTGAPPAPRSPRAWTAPPRWRAAPTRGLSIRAQRTRWASCSARGRMSFNWRLLLAPERVLDYVVWHEVCHLEILDHSPRFWALLERHWPGYREDRDVAATRNGATLVPLRTRYRRGKASSRARDRAPTAGPACASRAARSARSRRSRSPV